MTAPIKRTDTTTQMIIDFNKTDETNIHGTTNLSITEWKENRDNQTEQEMVQELYESFHYGWNNGLPRAREFLNKHTITMEMIDAIEDLYIYCEWNYGDYLHKTKLVDKLDMVFYMEAEEEFKKAIEVEELDDDFWG